MARPLRLERPGGRFHVTARGNERKPIYREDSDRTHFLELLAEATERFGLRVHAYVLMDNHYHLLVETPEANQGQVERAWDRLVAGLVLGTEAFARRLRRRSGGNAREQSALRKLDRVVAWPQIVKAVERVKGERWAEFSGRQGDWGRDAALWLGRKRGRCSLRQLVELAGGLDYAAVGQAVSRFGRRLDCDRSLRRALNEIEKYVKC